jgi:NADH-quinone oxidoreductase subunit L
MTQISVLLPWLLLLPLLSALITGLFGRRLGRASLTSINVGSSAVTLVLAGLSIIELSDAPAMAGMHTTLVAPLWTWLSSDSVTISVALMLDQLSAVLLLLVVLLSGLLHLFTVGYADEKHTYSRHSSYMHLFLFGMLVLLMAKNLLLLFVGWEFIALSSFLLVSLRLDDLQSAARGSAVFVLHRIGSFALLLGIFLLLFYSQGDLDLLRLNSLFQTGGDLDPLTVPGSAEQAGARLAVVTTLAILFLLAAATFAAQVPLHSWLPMSMTGPITGNALIQCTGTAIAGIYLLCRLNYIYVSSEVAMTVVASIGALTALVGSTSALVQTDLRKGLSYAAMAQTGFIFTALGVGAFEAALFQLIAIGCFIPCLFLATAHIIQVMDGEQDIRKMGGLRSRLRITNQTFFLACLGLLGMVPFASFASRGHMLTSTFTSSHHGAAPQTLIFGIGLVSSLIAAAGIFRFYYLTFGGEPRVENAPSAPAMENKTGVLALVSFVLLGLATAILGLPQFLGESLVLWDWLAPVFGNSEEHFVRSTDDDLQTLMLGISLLVGLAGWLAARTIYNRPTQSLPTPPNDALWHKFLFNGWYIDSFFRQVFKRPMTALAHYINRAVQAFSSSEKAFVDLHLLSALALIGFSILLALNV